MGDHRVDRIQRYMSEGYTFTCATCVNLYRARILRVTGCLGNRSGRSCKGPLGGGGYPEYDGPLKDNMTKHCFLTGEPSVGAVDVEGVLIGVSEKAVSVLGEYSEKGVEPPFITRKDLPVL